MKGNIMYARLLATILVVASVMFATPAAAETVVSLTDPRHTGCGVNQRVTIYVPEGITASTTTGDRQFTNGERITPTENLQIVFVADEGYDIEGYGDTYYWFFNDRPCKTPMLLEVYDSKMTREQYVITAYLATLIDETPYPGQYVRLQRYNFNTEQWVTVKSYVTNSSGSAHFTMKVDNLRYRMRFGGDVTHRWAISSPFSPRQ